MANDGANGVALSEPWGEWGGELDRRPREGDHFTTDERLVVTPAAGIFTPVTGLEAGTAIERGHLLGHVAEQEVRSPFAGVLQSFVALDGERVRRRQPIAWLRVEPR
jgi:[acyl-carrier-protein] S-malonyltransferase